MKASNDIIKKAIMFLKDKEKVSVLEIAEYLEIGYNLASKVIDIFFTHNLKI